MEMPSLQLCRCLWLCQLDKHNSLVKVNALLNLDKLLQENNQQKVKRFLEDPVQVDSHQRLVWPRHGL